VVADRFPSGHPSTAAETRAVKRRPFDEHFRVVRDGDDFMSVDYSRKNTPGIPGAERFDAWRQHECCPLGEQMSGC